MKLNMKEKKILYAYACPSHHNTVTRLKWLTALTVDPEAKSQMLHLARKIETETEERWYEAFYLTIICVWRWTNTAGLDAGCVR